MSRRQEPDSSQPPQFYLAYNPSFGSGPYPQAPQHSQWTPTDQELREFEAARSFRRVEYSEISQRNLQGTASSYPFNERSDRFETIRLFPLDQGYQGFRPTLGPETSQYSAACQNNSNGLCGQRSFIDLQSQEFEMYHLSSKNQSPSVAQESQEFETTPNLEPFVSPEFAYNPLWGARASTCPAIRAGLDYLLTPCHRGLASIQNSQPPPVEQESQGFGIAQSFELQYSEVSQNNLNSTSASSASATNADLYDGCEFLLEYFKPRLSPVELPSQILQSTQSIEILGYTRASQNIEGISSGPSNPQLSSYDQSQRFENIRLPTVDQGSQGCRPPPGFGTFQISETTPNNYNNTCAPSVGSLTLPPVGSLRRPLVASLNQPSIGVLKLPPVAEEPQGSKATPRPGTSQYSEATCSKYQTSQIDRRSHGFQTSQNLGAPQLSSEDLNQVRACTKCHLIKTTEYFLKEGCNNCPSLAMKGNLANVHTFATTDFRGIVCISTFGEKWEMNWYKINKYCLGQYAVSLSDNNGN